MAEARVMILAGHRRSLPTTILLRGLFGEPSARVVGVLCVRELSWKRLRRWKRRFGSGLWKRILRELPVGSRAPDPERETYLRYLQELEGGPSRPTVSAECRSRGIPFHVVPSLNSSRALELVGDGDVDFGIYTGGGILRKPLIERFHRGVLNVHSGPLPHIRGMSAVEWSLFFGLRPTATVHEIDEGIDTGAIYGSREVLVEPGDNLGALRARTVLDGMELLRELLPAIADGRVEPRQNPSGRGRQYFTMVNPLKTIVQDWIDRAVTPVTSAQEVEPEDLRTARQRILDHGPRSS